MNVVFQNLSREELARLMAETKDWGEKRLVTSERQVDIAESRWLYSDDDGKDWDIIDMRDALIAIRENSKPTAVSLSPPSLIKAIYEICCKAMP